MSNIKSFYENQGHPYSISEILNWSHEEWENKHDFIQWVFPTSKPSGCNSRAPILDSESAKCLALDENRILLKSLLDKFKQFLVKTRALDSFNHNFLRVSRVIQCLAEIGSNDESENFLLFCEKLHGNKNSFWTDSLASKTLV